MRPLRVCLVKPQGAFLHGLLMSLVWSMIQGREYRFTFFSLKGAIESKKIQAGIING